MNEIVKIPGGTYEDETHAYRDETGQRVISVTQVLSDLGIVNYDHIQKEILERKSQFGVAVHAAVQFLVEGSLDWDSVSEECLPAVVGVESWIKESDFISEEQEQCGICAVNGMKFGFKFDHRGKFFYKNKWRQAIIDLKTCVSISPAVGLQLAAYEIASPTLPNAEKYLRIAVQVDKKGKITPHFFEDRNDRNTFLYSLFVSTWKINHNIN